MPGLYASAVGGIVIVALVLIGVWLTWLSLNEETHRPKALQTPEPDEPE
jgi:hypothetical protein